MDRKPFPERLESERIVLKKHDPALAETMFRCVDSDRERLRVFLMWVDATRTLEDVAIYIKTTHEDWAKRAQFGYGLFDRVTGVYLGNVGVHAIEWEHACCELGYWILGAFEGKGYVSEAVSLLERACFGLGFHRVEIRCSSCNGRSAAIPKRLGYALEGMLRENAWEAGRYRDTLVFGKLDPGERFSTAPSPAGPPDAPVPPPSPARP